MLIAYSSCSHSIAPYIPIPVISLCPSSRITTGIADTDYTIFAASSIPVIGPHFSLESRS
jgi:hypothetical protein